MSDKNVKTWRDFYFESKYDLANLLQDVMDSGCNGCDAMEFCDTHESAGNCSIVFAEFIDTERNCKKAFYGTDDIQNIIESGEPVCVFGRKISSENASWYVLYPVGKDCAVVQMRYLITEWKKSINGMNVMTPDEVIERWRFYK